jgi:hypothetical protein
MITTQKHMKKSTTRYFDKLINNFGLTVKQFACLVDKSISTIYCKKYSYICRSNKKRNPHNLILQEYLILLKLAEKLNLKGVIDNDLILKDLGEDVEDINNRVEKLSKELNNE